MHCPTCDGPLTQCRPSTQTIHYFCPSCQPSYTESDPWWFTALAVAIVYTAVVISPFLELYRRYV